MEKPLLIYDGDCGFCRFWVLRWMRLTGGRVGSAPSQEAAAAHPEIPKETFERAVVLVEPGRTSAGAEAVFRLAAYAPGQSVWLWAYRRVPGFAPVSEAAYAVVAGHRPLFSKLNRWVFGAEAEPPRLAWTVWLFQRALGLIFLIAFASLWVQLDGLLGSQGILPIADLAKAVSGMGARRFLLVPSLALLNPSDGFLHLLCGAGLFFALLATLDLAPGFALLACWALYLSFVSAGREFMSFQWDALLLETGFLAVFLDPFKWKPGPREPSRAAVWLLRWLLFRLMFQSAAVKLLSGDTTWRDLTALTVHYMTQPLPTWIGWYAHQLPAWFQKLSTVMVFVIEGLVPFLIFLPSRRVAAFAALVFLQVLILLTGNYCYFNLLALSLCLLLLHDQDIEALLRRKLRARSDAGRGRRGSPALAAGCLIVPLTLLQFFGMFWGRAELPGPLVTAVGWASATRTVNTYGLFAVMTTKRGEIELEGSLDGKEWKTYGFKWKPGDLKRRPGFVAPHQPRLDWQMWFAVLGSYQDNPWYMNFMARLLTGSKPVAGLLETDPFPDSPPRYLRSVLYEYDFTDMATKRRDGTWWKREAKGLYAPVVSLR